jgi:hypothetical protein
VEGLSKEATLFNNPSTTPQLDSLLPLSAPSHPSPLNQPSSHLTPTYPYADTLPTCDQLPSSRLSPAHSRAVAAAPEQPIAGVPCHPHPYQLGSTPDLRHLFQHQGVATSDSAQQHQGASSCPFPVSVRQETLVPVPSPPPTHTQVRAVHMVFLHTRSVIRHCPSLALVSYSQGNAQMRDLLSASIGDVSLNHALSCSSLQPDNARPLGVHTSGLSRYAVLRLS